MSLNQSGQVVVKFDLLGQRRLVFDLDAVTHITSELYPIPLPGHLGCVAITTNRALRYEDIRWIGPIRRRQWWALVLGLLFGSLGLIGMFTNRTNLEAFVTSLVLFLLLGAFPLVLFLRGRTFLAIASEKSVICFPMDRQKKQVRQAIALLHKCCLAEKVHWEPLRN